MIQKHDHVYLELLNEIITLFVNENEWIAVVRYSFVYFFPLLLFMILIKEEIWS